MASSEAAEEAAECAPASGDGTLGARAGEAASASARRGTGGAPDASLSAESKGRAEAAGRARAAALKAFVLKNYLPLGLVLQLIVALSVPVLGRSVADVKAGDYRVCSTILVCVIFFASGLGLKTEDIKTAVKTPLPLAYGVIAILVLTPCMSFVALEVPVKRAFQTGLALFCCVPTTLTSGVALASQAKGNAALALLLTVSSNLLGIFTVPFALQLVLRAASDARIDAVALLEKLVISILIPLAIGKAVREASAQAQTFVKRYKTELGLLNHTCLLLVVWQTMSRSADFIKSESAENLLGVILCGVVLHLIFLVVNYALVFGVLGNYVGEKEKRTLLLLSSQKTLPVSVTIIAFLDEDVVGPTGLLAIPCVIGHMSQLFIDAVIAARWAERDPDAAAAADGPTLSAL